MKRPETHIYLSTGCYETAFRQRHADVVYDELLGYGTFSKLHAVFFRADQHLGAIPVRSDVTAHDLGWPKKPRWLAEGLFLRWLNALIQRNYPCVVTAYDPFLSGFNAYLVAMRHRVPFVQYVGCNFEEWRARGQRLFRVLPGERSEAWCERWVYRHATRVRTWNHYYRDYALKMGAPPTRTIALPPSPFNDAYYSPEQHSSGRHFADPRVPLVAAIQRLKADKLVSKLVPAFVQIRHRLPTARFIIAGDGPERAVMQRQAEELCVADAIEFVGHLDVGDLLALMLRADVLIGGHAGRTLIEASLCGLEAVVYDFDWHRECFDLVRAGRAIPLEDASAMAAAALAVLGQNNAGRHELRERAHTVFGRNAIAQQTRVFYEQLFSESF